MYSFYTGRFFCRRSEGSTKIHSTWNDRSTIDNDCNLLSAGFLLWWCYWGSAATRQVSKLIFFILYNSYSFFRFGMSISGSMLVAKMAWPNEWVLLIGSFMACTGAGLQCLCSKYSATFKFFSAKKNPKKFFFLGKIQMQMEEWTWKCKNAIFAFALF